VSTGWRAGHEANEVRYEPGRVTVAQMVEALRRAGTYLKTLEE
jgi:hypothetical protein